MEKDLLLLLLAFCRSRIAQQSMEASDPGLLSLWRTEEIRALMELSSAAVKKGELAMARAELGEAGDALERWNAS
jgi:hypothetical protein